MVVVIMGAVSRCSSTESAQVVARIHVVTNVCLSA